MRTYVIGGALALVLAGPAWATHFESAGSTATPGGFYDQCYSKRDLCNVHRGRAGTLAQAQAINDRVNAQVVQAPGSRSWDPTSSSGDCKVFAMRKYRMLLSSGWSSAGVRLAETGTAVRSDHIVVVVTVGDTDWVMDVPPSRSVTARALVPWDRGGYVWRKIQSRENPQVWKEAP